MQTAGAAKTNDAKQKEEDEMFWIIKKKSHKKEDERFHTKHVEHNSEGKSARAVFGLKKSSNSER